MDEKMKVEVLAYQVIEKIVKLSGNSGRVYVPKEWVGKKVKIFLLEPASEEKIPASIRKKGEGV